MRVVAWAIGAAVFITIYAVIRRTRPGQQRPFSEDLPWLVAILLISGVIAFVGTLSR